MLVLMAAIIACDVQTLSLTMWWWLLYIYPLEGNFTHTLSGSLYFLIDKKLVPVID